MRCKNLYDFVWKRIFGAFYNFKAFSVPSLSAVGFTLLEAEVFCGRPASACETIASLYVTELECDEELGHLASIREICDKL